MVENKKDIAELKKLLSKCLSPLEKPMKKEVEQAVIKKTYDIKCSHSIWLLGEKLNLTLNTYTIWKFCILMHKILHKGHKQSLCDGLAYKKKLEKYGYYWRNLRDETTGQCIAFYCQLLLRKLQFHEVHKHFRGNLEMEYEPEFNVDRMFHICLDILDYLEDLIHMQRLIFTDMESHNISLASKKGMCRVSTLPLIASESYLLYQHSINALQFLDSTLCHSDISGLVKRFNQIVCELQLFYAYSQSHNLPQMPILKWPIEWSNSKIIMDKQIDIEEMRQIPQPSAPNIMDFENVYS